ncbi:MAG: GTPase HflX [Halobacteria archaeon]
MKALLVMLRQGPGDPDVWTSRMEEMEAIARAAGYAVLDRVTQTRARPDPKFLVGAGKVEEVKSRLDAAPDAVVVFWDRLTSRQKYDLEKTLERTVLDRAELILELFRKNARTPEAKMQIELALLRKRFPVERFRASERLKGEQPGPKGRGEFAYLREVKQMRAVVRRTSERLKSVQRQRGLHRKARAGKGPLVALTGFYNAGKSTLFNALTRGSQEVADHPFTTLSSKVGRLHSPAPVFVADSIGLVQAMDDLEEIVASFDLTLEEVRAADRVLLVVDASEPPAVAERKLWEARRVLGHLKVDPDRVLLVWSKVDRADGGRLPQAGGLESVAVSARTGEGMAELKSRLAGLVKDAPGAAVPS